MKPRPPTERKAGTDSAATRRSKALRSAALLAVLVLPTAAACGIQPTGITELGTAPAAIAASPAQAFDTSPGSSQFLVYFYQKDRLAPVYRSAKGEVTERIVLDALIGGPSQAEQSAGFSSAVPTDLNVKLRADNEAGAYNLSEQLEQRAKSQFICTMQYFDQLDSIGIQVGGSRPIWNSCSDTTTQFIQMRGDGSSASVPSLSPSGNGN